MREKIQTPKDEEMWFNIEILSREMSTSDFYFLVA